MESCFVKGQNIFTISDKGAAIEELRSQVEGSLNALADATSKHANE